MKTAHLFHNVKKNSKAIASPHLSGLHCEGADRSLPTSPIRPLLHLLHLLRLVVPVGQKAGIRCPTKNWIPARAAAGLRSTIGRVAFSGDGNVLHLARSANWMKRLQSKMTDWLV